MCIFLSVRTRLIIVTQQYYPQRCLGNMFLYALANKLKETKQIKGEGVAPTTIDKVQDVINLLSPLQKDVTITSATTTTTLNDNLVKSCETTCKDQLELNYCHHPFIAKIWQF